MSDANVDGLAFREAIAHFATGVTVVTTTYEGRPAGMTASAVCSLSLDPVLLVVCIDNRLATHKAIEASKRFAVNVLGRHHERFAMRATPAGTDRFAGLDWQPGHGGIPLLTDALATLECEIVAEHPTGDHWIVVGRVDNLRTSPITDPLVFFAGALGALK